MDLKSGLGPLWLIYFISLLFFFLSRGGVCGWKGQLVFKGLSRWLGWEVKGAGPLFSSCLQSGFPQSSGYTSGSPTSLPGTALGSPWALEVMCKNAHTEGDVPVTCCVSLPQDKAQFFSNGLSSAPVEPEDPEHCGWFSVTSRNLCTEALL